MKKTEKQKLANKAHITMCWKRERFSRRRRVEGRRLVKYRITLSVTERKIVRESEEECLCVTIY